MKAVILVGGEGTRLRPLTLLKPKPLMPVGNRPFLEHVMAWLGRYGITEAILTTGYLSEAFADFDATHGVKLTVVHEQTLLGTAGAVRNVAEHIDGTFLVLNGDILTDLNLERLIKTHRDKEATGTLALTEVEDPSAYGLVPTDPDGRIERFVEKPRGEEGFPTRWVNAGTYVLEPEVLSAIPEGRHFMFERGVFPSMVETGKALFGYRSHSYWLDMGTPPKYVAANVDVLERKCGLAPPGEPHRGAIWVNEGAELHEDARLAGPVAVGRDVVVAADATIWPGSTLGDGVVVSGGARIEQSVVHAGARIGPGAVLQRAVVGEGAQIGEDCIVSDAIVGANTIVGADVHLRNGVRLWPDLKIPDGAIRF